MKFIDQVEILHYTQMLFTQILISMVHPIDKKKKKHSGSLKELVDIPISQRSSIRMGIYLERSLKQLVKNKDKSCGIEFIDMSKIGNTQIDLIFKKNSIVFYFEIKSNINLDSEKLLATYTKIKNVKYELQIMFPTNKIICKILSLRYPHFISSENISKIKYTPMKNEDMIWGYETFFQLINEPIDEQTWIKLLNQVAIKLNQYNQHK